MSTVKVLRSLHMTLADTIVSKATRMGYGSLFYQKRILKTEKFIPRAQLLPLIQKNIQDPELLRLQCRLDVDKDYPIPCEDFNCDNHVSEEIGDFEFEEKINETGSFDGPFLTEQNGSYGPGWDLKTCSNGKDHFIMIRLDHWIGDGISTMSIVSKLLGFEYPMPEMIKKRVSPEKIKLADVPSVLYVLKDMIIPRYYSSPMLGLARDHFEAMDAHRIIIFPAFDINKLKAAAKNKDSTLTRLLMHVLKQFQLNYYELIGEKPPKVCKFGTTMASYREVPSNMSFISIFKLNYSNSFEVDDRKMIDEINYVIRGTLNLQVIQNFFFKLMTPEKLAKFIYASAFKRNRKDVPVQLCTFMATSFPGPKSKVEICGVPVLSWYNSVSTGHLPTYNMTGYGNTMNIALTCPKHIYDQKESINRLWAASFEQITGETFESLLLEESSSEEKLFAVE